MSDLFEAFIKEEAGKALRMLLDFLHHSNDRSCSGELKSDSKMEQNSIGFKDSALKLSLLALLVLIIIKLMI